MSRQKAKDSFTQSALKKLLSQAGVTLIGGSVEEMPLAYKDIDRVMYTQETLVEVQGAQAQLDKARADLIMAKQQVNLQRAALRLAIGDLTLDATQPIKPVAQLATAQAVAAVSPSNP